MEKKENKASAILMNIDIVVASIILAILIVLTFLGVVWRYIFNAPFTWLEEVQTSCMVWIVFAGAGAAFRSGNHVAIEMIVDLMPKSMQKIMEILISIVVVVVIGYLFMQSIGFIQVFVKSGRSTSMLKIPYSWVYGIAILSYFDMIISYFLKVPVFIAVLGGSMVYFVMNPGINTVIFAQQAIIGTEKISLMAIPFFVCAGIFMNYTGVTKRIMDFCEVVTGRLPGGLAQVNVLLSTVMGGLSGSNIADAAMESKMMVPEMTKKGFSLEFSSVVTAASSMITPLIPPGIAMILYGCIANVSIGKLFISGLGVGGLLCVSMMILVGVVSKKRGYGILTTEKLTWSKFWTALKPAILPLPRPEQLQFFTLHFWELSTMRCTSRI